MSATLRAALLLGALGVLGCDDVMKTDPGCRVVGAETAISKHFRYMATCTFNKEQDVKFVMLCGQDDAARRAYEVQLLQADGGVTQESLFIVPHRPRNLNGARIVERGGQDFVPQELHGSYRLSVRGTGPCFDEDGKQLQACTLTLQQIRLCQEPQDCACEPPPEGAPSASAAASAAAPSAAPPAPSVPPPAAPSAAPSAAPAASATP